MTLALVEDSPAVRCPCGTPYVPELRHKTQRNRCYATGCSTIAPEDADAWKLYPRFERPQPARTNQNTLVKSLSNKGPERTKTDTLTAPLTTHPCPKCGLSVLGRGKRLCSTCRGELRRIRLAEQPTRHCVICGGVTFDVGACASCRNKAARFRKRVGVQNEERAFVIRVAQATQEHPRAGVYAIWSPDKTRAYVGEAQDVDTRWHDGHKTAILLGCVPELLAELPNSTKETRLTAEQEAIGGLKARGVLIVNAQVPAHA